MLAVMGNSGFGKSTMLNICGVFDLREGKVRMVYEFEYVCL